MNATARARRAKNPERQKEKDRATYQRRIDKEHERAKRRAKDPREQARIKKWRAEKVDHLREYDRQRGQDPDYIEIRRAAGAKFRREKPDQAQAHWKRHHRENRLKINASAARRRELNKDVINAKMRQRKKNDPETYYAYGHARRARLKANGGRWSKQDIIRIRAEQNDLCAFCKTPLNGRGERDHIVPPGYGGTNDTWNIQLTCDGPSSCNKKKNDTHPIIFMLRVRAGLVVLRSPPAKWAGREAAE